MAATTLRQQVYAALPVGEDHRGAAWMAALVIGNVVLATAATLLQSVPELQPHIATNTSIALLLCGSIFFAELLLRFWTAPECDRLWRTFPVLGKCGAYLFSFHGVIDLLACVPLVFVLAGFASTGWLSLFGVIPLFKLSRYVTSLELVGAAIHNERHTLMALVLTLGLLLVVLSTCLFLIEREAQPAQFKSIPHTMWWGIVTLTTVGYGDMSPVTLTGRILGGMTMLIGIGMLAMPTGVIALGFANERRRRELLQNWKIVSGLPLFKGLDANWISEISGLLRSLIVPAHVIVITKGEFSTSLFFIVDGEVEIDLFPAPRRLKSGDFFGEAGLLQNKPRSATVTTVKPTRFLVLGLAEYQSLISRAPDLRQKLEETAAQRTRESR
ncbi:cyclic nucleotide-gated ion channel [Rhodoferax sp.]|uniref:cyclic nucleotide-gated ion channel n=1 Tax=Rhodoferax sp. TaxID=50421 RepID=UPI0026342677|nr:cyclic nucleotide-gated ion channel [Rhodoferax sp.]MDD2918337.1 cyclic nucleotide-gated ion channel [Rhodoferax sp.]